MHFVCFPGAPVFPSTSCRRSTLNGHVGGVLSQWLHALAAMHSCTHRLIPGRVTYGDGAHLRVPGRRDLRRTAARHRRACAASGERTHIRPARFSHVAARVQLTPRAMQAVTVASARCDSIASVRVTSRVRRRGGERRRWALGCGRVHAAACTRQPAANILVIHRMRERRCTWRGWMAQGLAWTWHGASRAPAAAGTATRRAPAGRT